MKRSLTIVVMTAFCSGTLYAQTPSGKGCVHVPVPVTTVRVVGKHAPHHHHASTAAEGLLRGQAAVIDALVRSVLHAAEAASQVAVAQRQYLENRQVALANYREARKLNADTRAEERSSTPQPAIVAVKPGQARQQPDPPVLQGNAIQWPTLLQGKEYTGYRNQLETLLARYGSMKSIAPEERQDLAHATAAVLAQVKERIREVRTKDYLAAKSFLETVTKETRG
jgi:hypothetical protein